MYVPEKTYISEKGSTLCLLRQCDRNSKLSWILTQPVNPCAMVPL